MKNLLAAAVVVFMSLNFAQADDNSGRPAEAIQIRGEKAVELVKALEDAGATPHVMVDLSQLSVQNLEVVEGFLPPQGEYATLTASQAVFGPVGTNFVRMVEIKANGEKARAVFSALETAGVQRTQEVENALISVRTVLCNTGLIPGGTSCTITVAE